MSIAALASPLFSYCWLMLEWPVRYATMPSAQIVLHSVTTNTHWAMAACVSSNITAHWAHVHRRRCVRWHRMNCSTITLTNHMFAWHQISVRVLFWPTKWHSIVSDIATARMAPIAGWWARDARWESFRVFRFDGWTIARDPLWQWTREPAHIASRAWTRLSGE